MAAVIAYAGAGTSGGASLAGFAAAQGPGAPTGPAATRTSNDASAGAASPGAAASGTAAAASGAPAAATGTAAGLVAESDMPAGAAPGRPGAATATRGRQLPSPPCDFADVDWSEPYTFKQLQAFCDIGSPYAGEAKAAGHQTQLYFEGLEF